MMAHCTVTKKRRRPSSCVSTAQADSLPAKIAAEAERYRTAFAMQYGSIFFITTIVCLAGAAIALFIGGRNARAADESAQAVAG